MRCLVTDATRYRRYLQKQEMYFLAFAARQFDISVVTGSSFVAEKWRVASDTFVYIL